MRAVAARALARNRRRSRSVATLLARLCIGCRCAESRCTGFGWAGWGGVIGALLRFAADRDAGVGVTASALAGREGAEVTDVLLRLADDVGDVRKAAAEALREHDVPTSALIRLVSTAHADARWIAAQMLAGRTAPDVTKALIVLAADDDADVRRAAADALARRDGTEVTNTLLTLLKDHRLVPSARQPCRPWPSGTIRPSSGRFLYQHLIFSPIRQQERRELADELRIIFTFPYHQKRGREYCVVSGGLRHRFYGSINSGLPPKYSPTRPIQHSLSVRQVDTEVVEPAGLFVAVGAIASLRRLGRSCRPGVSWAARRAGRE